MGGAPGEREEIIQIKKLNNENIIQINDNKNCYPLECIFSNMEIASIAMHATISMDILN